MAEEERIYLANENGCLIFNLIDDKYSISIFQVTKPANSWQSVAQICLRKRIPYLMRCAESNMFRIITSKHFLSYK